jgi:hypothetical protein
MRSTWKTLFRFLLSCLILTGGAYLAARYPEMRQEVGAAVAAVVGWWFTKAVTGGRSRNDRPTAPGGGATSEGPTLTL